MLSWGIKVITLILEVKGAYHLTNSLLSLIFILFFISFPSFKYKFYRNNILYDYLYSYTNAWNLLATIHSNVD